MATVIIYLMCILVGIGDIIIGAVYTNVAPYYSTGAVYGIYGTADAHPDIVLSTGLNATTGFRVICIFVLLIARSLVTQTILV